LRILNITHLFPNAIQQAKGLSVQTQLFELAKRGHDVSILVPTPLLARNVYGTFSLVLIPRVSKLGAIHVYRFPYVELPSILKFLGVVTYLLGLATWTNKLERYDVIHVHFLYPDAFAVRAMLTVSRKRVRLIVTARGSDVHEYAGYSLLRALTHWTLKGFPRVLCVSEALRRELASRLPPSASRIGVVHNGVDLGLFYPRDRVSSRKRSDLDPKLKIVAYVGRFTRKKGVPQLIPLANVIHRIGGSQLVFVGAGPELGRLLDAQSAWGDSVRVLGPVSHEMMPYLMSAIDVLVFPSPAEGFPNAVLESIACGTPVVGFNIDAMTEIIPKNSDKCGILVEAGNYEALFAAVEAALMRSWDRSTVASTVLELSWRNIVKELEREYENL
jgi:teichuronic acid biosynthesis glycosyltransferase TuaC